MGRMDCAVNPGDSYWRTMLLTGFLLNFFIGQGSSIYFSQPVVNISRTFVPETGFLYAVKATTKQNEDGQIQYSISKPEIHGQHGKKNGKARTGICADLAIDQNLGNISILLPSKEVCKSGCRVAHPGLACTYTVTARLERNAAQSVEDETTMKFVFTVPNTLTIVNNDTVNCKVLSQKELCFAGASHLELRVMENAPVTPLAYLGSLPGMCGMIQVSYDVNMPEGVLTATKVSNYEPLTDIIQSKANLDREEIEVYNLTVDCIIKYLDEPNETDIVRIEGGLVVLDENDNPPIREESTPDILIMSLSDDGHQMKPNTRLSPKDHSELLSTDRDSMAVNNLKVYSVNDTKQLFVLDLVQYRLAEFPGNNISGTATILKIVLSEHSKYTQGWIGYYCVLAVLNDSTIIQSERGKDIKYTICLSWGLKPALATPPDQLSPTDLARRLSSRVTETSLSRSAQKFAPVLYPFPDLVQDWSEAVSGLEFTLTHLFTSVVETTYLDGNSTFEDDVTIPPSSYPLNIFDVTPQMGIIYLIQPELIRNLSIHSFRLQLYCNSSIIPSFATNITINLESLPDAEKICEDDELCAVHADSKSCEMTCGYGSRGKCMWRHEPDFNNSIGGNESIDQYNNAPGYPTCSPHLETCPDGKCDELEKLFPRLCPQDCATKTRGLTVLLKRSNQEKYGIDGRHCKGVGSCQDDTTCSCGHLPPPPKEGESTHYEHRPNPHEGKLEISTLKSECGVQCLMTFFAIFMIAAAFIMFSVYIWKARADREKKSRSHNHTVMMTANGIEIPFGESGHHHHHRGGLISEADYIARGLNHAAMLVSDDQFAQYQIVQVDSKWEISRDSLLLEHVLGEGQYGRVLKGRLHGHSGTHIPVAVKMLKVDATEGSKSLWQEFMAEFSLLKQVDHPNVIKLLGACTTTGGPPYLVMEYAEYGALRSFLRKCRRVEQITGSQCALQQDHGDLPTTPDPLDLDYIVTPREVLGFSWQIAKGMAYLSDMKMVHRDLAARNILLTKLKVCKISDFGLTRDIYVDDAYQKKSKDRVPVKWLAPECLADELYTTKSDVWAFGVLVWELTTLGASPYPGIQSEQLYCLLNAGYRMPQPQNCSNELFSLMKRCWAYQPAIRPTFHQIVLELSKMLEDGIEYLKLDIPSVSNPGYDFFSQSERVGSDIVNLSPTNISPITDMRPLGRRKLSMENLRLIDYEISTDDEFLSKPSSNSHSCTKHTYINDPQPCQQDCSNNRPPEVSSSGYESPIRSSTSVAV